MLIISCAILPSSMPHAMHWHRLYKKAALAKLDFNLSRSGLVRTVGSYRPTQSINDISAAMLDLNRHVSSTVQQHTISSTVESGLCLSNVNTTITNIMAAALGPSQKKDLRKACACAAL